MTAEERRAHRRAIKVRSLNKERERLGKPLVGQGRRGRRKGSKNKPKAATGIWLTRETKDRLRSKSLPTITGTWGAVERRDALGMVDPEGAYRLLCLRDARIWAAKHRAMGIMEEWDETSERKIEQDRRRYERLHGQGVKLKAAAHRLDF
jgi:hypothetical protein